jgi:hypothetical protein
MPTPATVPTPIDPPISAAPVAPPFGPISPPSDPISPPSGPVTPSPQPPSSSDFRFFSPTSIWNQPLLPDAPIDPNSPAITGTLQAYVNTSLANRTGPWINTTQYSTPIYTVPANQPTVGVVMDYNNPLAAVMAAVPIPANAQPAAGSDDEITIYQPSSDTLWEMWRMRQALDPPPYLSGAVGSGGSLPAGTYYYAVTALTQTGETTVSPVHAYAVPAGGKLKLSWGGPVAAIGYRIYRGSDAAHLQLVAAVPHVTTQLSDPNCVWTDDGSSTPSAVAPPSANTATTPGQWHASWGGRIQHVSLDPGYYRDISDGHGGFSEQASWGVTASSLPVVGGLITLSDLASGYIDHAIAIMVPQAAKGVFTFPAQRTDGVSTAPNAIPEGARFRLPPDLNLSALQMPPITRMIAEAAQKYGFIVNDQTGATVGFRAEDPMPLIRQGQPSPYQTYFKASINGGYEDPNFLLASFPWADLELVAPGS